MGVVLTCHFTPNFYNDIVLYFIDNLVIQTKFFDLTFS